MIKKLHVHDPKTISVLASEQSTGTQNVIRFAQACTGWSSSENIELGCTPWRGLSPKKTRN